MIDELYRRVETAGIEVDRELYEGSRRLIERELAIQIATVAFDEADATRRRLVLDTQVETAAQLLRDGASQHDLFALAEARQTVEGGDN